jgi:hypothetical protein
METRRWHTVQEQLYTIMRTHKQHIPHMLTAVKSMSFLTIRWVWAAEHWFTFPDEFFVLLILYQVEKHYADGRKEIIFPNKTKKTIYPNQYEVSFPIDMKCFYLLVNKFICPMNDFNTGEYFRWWCRGEGIPWRPQGSHKATYIKKHFLHINIPLRYIIIPLYIYS